MKKLFVTIAECAIASGAVNVQTVKVFNKNVGIGLGSNNPTQKFHVVGNSFFDGKVGIGSSSPTATLDIIGNVGSTNGWLWIM
jgi:hypothetical protein